MSRQGELGSSGRTRAPTPGGDPYVEHVYAELVKHLQCARLPSWDTAVNRQTSHHSHGVPYILAGREGISDDEQVNKAMRARDGQN